jgi:hypothetical protein
MEGVKIIKKTKIGEQENDVAYWRMRPATERWEAMLKVREQAWRLYCIGQKIPYINDRPFQFSVTKRSL